MKLKPVAKNGKKDLNKETYTIGEVEKISGIRSHILRYWEEVIPGWATKKDANGRRVYTSQDISVIMRLKYLIYEKKYTIEGARDQIIKETDAVQENADLIKELQELRGELASLLNS